MRTTAAVCVVLVGLFAICIRADDGFSKRSTSKGAVKGVEVVSKDNNSTVGYKFLGIPYAQPPLRDLRYKKPQDVAAWKDVFDATRLKAQCLALPNVTKESGNFTTITTENCLYINLIVPEQCVSNNSCPILVRIPNSDENPNTALAETFAFENGILLATISYRVRSFGFLNLSPSLGISQNTNVALHDIDLALNWIFKEAKVFGGDSAKIALYGDRNAAFLIDLLSLSPKTNSLFSRSILLSASAEYRKVAQKSSCCSSRVFSIQAQCAKSYTEFAQSKDAELVLNCLRSRDPNYLLDVEGKLKMPELFETPMLDGSSGFFPDTSNRTDSSTLLISFTNEHLLANDLVSGGQVNQKKLQEVCEDLVDDPELSKECQWKYRKPSSAINIYNDKRIYFGFIKSALSMIKSNGSVYLMEVYGDREEKKFEIDLKNPESIFAKLIASFVHNEANSQNQMEKFTSDKQNYYLLEEDKFRAKKNYHGEAVEFWVKVDLKQTPKVKNGTQCCETKAEKQLLSKVKHVMGDSMPKEHERTRQRPIRPNAFIAPYQWSPLHNVWFTVALFIVIFAVLFLIRRWIRDRERLFSYERLSNDMQLHLFEKKTIYG